MRTLELKAVVNEEGQVTLQLPLDIKPGEYQIVLVIAEQLAVEPNKLLQKFPVIDIGHGREILR